MPLHSNFRLIKFSRHIAAIRFLVYSSEINSAHCEISLEEPIKPVFPAFPIVCIIKVRGNPYLLRDSLDKDIVSEEVFFNRLLTISNVGSFII